jgi:SAM-dependent methyltransferase
LRRGPGPRAGIPPDIETLSAVYLRQYRELAHLRRHILSMLPVRSWRSVVEPGCGTGLLAAELTGLTGASYTGIDVDARAIAMATEAAYGRPGCRFVCRDARDFVPRADAYVSQFFLTALVNPVVWLQEVRRALPRDGVYAVFAEYDYGSLREEPAAGLAAAVRDSLEADGFSTGIGGELDELFTHAGFTVDTSGSVAGPLQEPDSRFLDLQLGGSRAGEWKGTRLSWTVAWGIYRKQDP